MIPGLFDKAIQRDSLTENRPWDVRVKRDSNGSPRMEMKVYNGTGGTLTANNWYEIRYDGDEETNPTLAAVASGAATGLTNKYVCVATEAAASGTWTYVVIWGYYSPFVEGTTDVAKDDFLKFDTSVATAAPIKDGSNPTRNSVAIACEAQTTAGVTTAAKVFILGERIGIDA